MDGRLSRTVEEQESEERFGNFGVAIEAPCLHRAKREALVDLVALEVTEVTLFLQAHNFALHEIRFNSYICSSGCTDYGMVMKHVSISNRLGSLLCNASVFLRPHPTFLQEGGRSVLLSVLTNALFIHCPLRTQSVLQGFFARTSATSSVLGLQHPSLALRSWLQAGNDIREGTTLAAGYGAV